jgi:hypothetical protein
MGSGANKTSEAAEVPAGSYLLRYQFKKDEVLNYQVDHETTMITTKPEFVEKVSNEVHSRKQNRVVALDSQGNATLELSIEDTKMSAQFGEAQPVSFDSRNPQDCPESYKVIRDIVGKPLARVRVTPRGELLQSVPLLPLAVMKKAKLVKADGTLSDDASRNFLVEFPENALKVGDIWTNVFKVNVSVSRSLTQAVTMQRSYELLEVKDGLATIKLRSGLITPINDGMILAQLIQMSPSGTIVFDIENGRLVSRTLVIDKTEVGVIGGDSSMQAKSKREERWIDPKAEKQADG